MSIFKRKSYKNKDKSVYALEYINKLIELLKTPINIADYSIDSLPKNTQMDWKLRKIYTFYFTTHGNYDEWVFTPLNKKEGFKKFYYIITTKNKKLERIYDITLIVQAFTDKVSTVLNKNIDSLTALTALNDYLEKDDVYRFLL